MSQSLNPVQHASLAEGLKVQLRIIGSLLLRELHIRFGREGIGFVWFIGEPMMLATVITLVHLAQTSNHASSDFQVAPFAIIGYTVFIIFRGIFNRAEGAIDGNSTLFYHRMISIFDLLIARGIIEVTGCFVTMVILLTIIVLLGLGFPPARPLYLFGAVLLMAWWSSALGMIAAVVSYRSETMGRQIHVISYFTIPISGAFWQMSWLTPGFRDWLQWFPMPLIFEQARYGMFRAGSSEYVRPDYVIAWCAVLTYLALLLIRRLRRRLQV